MSTILPQHATPKSVTLFEYGGLQLPALPGTSDATDNEFTPIWGRYLLHLPAFSQPGSSPALLMALAAEAARQQDQYWTMHHALFAYTDPVSLNSLLKLALEVGINPERFLDDMHNESLKKRIWADMELGRQSDVVETPTLFLGTRRLHGKLTQARLVPLMTHYVSRSKASFLGTVDCENGLVLWA